jgi:hypothetical protein
VVALPRIDPIRVLGSNPIISKGEQNTNVGFILSHEETTNISSTTLKKFEDVQGEVQLHNSNMKRLPLPLQMPSLFSIQAVVDLWFFMLKQGTLERKMIYACLSICYKFLK